MISDNDAAHQITTTSRTLAQMNSDIPEEAGRPSTETLSHCEHVLELGPDYEHRAGRPSEYGLSYDNR